MRITVLAVPDCPGAALLRIRLETVVEEAGGAVVTWREVTTAEEAAALGMTGSPTLLIDGTDPFREPGLRPGWSCRLYRDPGGPPEPAPSLARLRAALGQAGAPR